MAKVNKMNRFDEITSIFDQNLELSLYVQPDVYKKRNCVLFILSKNKEKFAFTVKSTPHGLSININ